MFEKRRITDISAGLSISVVKNALYKVIRCSGPDDLGKQLPSVEDIQKRIGGTNNE